MFIRSRKDAQEFVAELNQYTAQLGSETRFAIDADRYIEPTYARPATITVRIHPTGTWQSIAIGPAWREQGWSTITDSAGWVYAHRAGLNQALREQNCYTYTDLLLL